MTIEAWAINTESLGMTRYTGLPLNSAAFSGGVLYGLSSAGLCRGGGTTDAGTAIQSTIKTGLSSFGTSREKSLPGAYLHYTSTGALSFSTVTTERGVKIKRTYPVRARTAAVPTEALVSLRMGVQAALWGFEVDNLTTGAAFRIDALQLAPTVSQRRIQRR